jgi:hypothetical protein
MAIVPTSYKNAASFSGPAFEVLDTYTQQNLLAGASPARSQPVRILLASSTNLAKFSVVGLDASKNLVLATWNATPASAITPIGVLEHAAVSGASNTTIYGEVVLTGNYNIDADSPLVWSGTFDTAAKKAGSVVGDANLAFNSRSVA